MLKSIAVTAGCVALFSASPALAAGGGYGGGAPGAGGAPAGFSGVAAVFSVNASKGGHIGRGPVLFTVPRGAKQGELSLVVFKGNNGSAHNAAVGALKRDRVLDSFGVGVRSGSSAASTGKPITVTFSAKGLKPGDTLAVYNSKTRKFVAVKAKFTRGSVTFTLKSSESVAVFG